MKTLAFLDCPTGIAGDMCLGALVDAGVPLAYLQTQLAHLALPEPYAITAETVRHNGIAATQVQVHLEPDADAVVSPLPHPPERHLADILALIQAAPLPARAIAWSCQVFERLAAAEGAIHGVEPGQVHFHEVGATDAIVDIVGTCLGLDWLQVDALYCSPLPTGNGTVRAAHGRLPVPAPAVLKLMTMAQVPIYSNGLSGELVTPTGAAIATTLCTQFGDPPPMVLQRVGLGAGNRSCALPNMLRLWLGKPQISGAKSHYLTQPIAIAGNHSPPHGHDHAHSHADQFDPHYSSAPGASPPTPGVPESGLNSGLHAEVGPPSPLQGETETDKLLGDRVPTAQTLPAAHPEGVSRDRPEAPGGVETVMVLETQVDDLTPQAIGYVSDRLLQTGALDVFTQAIGMKKSRPGHLLTVIAYPDQADRCETILFEETTTLGVRRQPQQRRRLGRSRQAVATPWGTVTVKLAWDGQGQLLNAHPEYEDCARLARAHQVPWHTIHHQALYQWQQCRQSQGVLRSPAEHPLESPDKS
jgi:uncharacterized protein (DUF111 family)